jgi:hypothetical protein
MSIKQKVIRLLVALGLSKLSPAQISANAKHYVQKMTGNTLFPAPSPTLAALNAQIAAFDAAYNTSLTKARGTVSAMRSEEKSLKILLKGLAVYVETVANADPDHAASIIEDGAGMPLKKPSVRKPKTFTVRNGTEKGTVLLDSKAVRGSVYLYEMTTDPNTPSSWLSLGILSKVKFTKIGLTSGTHYYFRVAVVTKGIQSNWSPVIDLIVL